MNSSKDDALLEVPIRASLWKSVLLAGADRRVTIVVIGSCMVLILLSGFALWPCITAAVLASIGQLIGVKMAVVDPHLIDVYLRHISYNRCYSARPNLSSPDSAQFPSIPKV